MLARLNNIDFDKINIFISILFQLIFQIHLKIKFYLNIDELTILSLTKIIYLSSIKGGNKEINNSPFIGGLLIILDALSNGS